MYSGKNIYVLFNSEIKMPLIVIEGDNASGKTTLTEYFQKNGYSIPTLESETLALEKAAKSKTGEERFKDFIAYNSVCGELSRKNKNSLIIRYWISTVAASYADNIYSLEQAIEKAVELNNKFPVPDFVFCLKCRYDIRIERINDRKKETGDLSDNVTIERDKKYQQILEKLEGIVKNWFNIDTVANDPEQVFSIMDKVIFNGNGK
jgi:thymidylate kinase